MTIQVGDKDELKKRGLIFRGRHLPYNPKLVDRARQLRKNMTMPEKKLWDLFLKKLPDRVLAQRPIDNYIVDFYCPKCNLVIEIDGPQHLTTEGKQYDVARDTTLQSYGLTVLRISNDDVMDDFDSVCKTIMDKIPPLIPPLLRGDGGSENGS